MNSLSEAKIDFPADDDANLIRLEAATRGDYLLSEVRIYSETPGLDGIKRQYGTRFRLAEAGKIGEAWPSASSDGIADSVNGWFDVSATDLSPTFSATWGDRLEIKAGEVNYGRPVFQGHVFAAESKSSRHEVKIGAIELRYRNKDATWDYEYLNKPAQKLLFHTGVEKGFGGDPAQDQKLYAQSGLFSNEAFLGRIRQNGDKLEFYVQRFRGALGLGAKEGRFSLTKVIYLRIGGVDSTKLACPRSAPSEILANIRAECGTPGTKACDEAKSIVSMQRKGESTPRWSLFSRSTDGFEAWRDEQTGLIWSEAVGTESVSQDDAAKACSVRIDGGWRLPTADEFVAAGGHGYRYASLIRSNEYFRSSTPRTENSGEYSAYGAGDYVTGSVYDMPGYAPSHYDTRTVCVR